MKAKLFLAFTGLALLLAAQVRIDIIGGTQPVLAVPDFRGAAESAPFANAFNETLYRDLQDSGLFQMAAKSMYPLETPQQPQDFREPLPPVASKKKGEPPQPVRRGPWLTDWSEPPVAASHLAFGYLSAQGGSMVLSGWLYDVKQANLTSAHLFGKRYLAAISEDGARQMAHEFAADIIRQFGGTPLFGSKIYFISNRTGSDEIWSMDSDGSNQKQFTTYKSLTITPAVSPDGRFIAFTTYAGGNPAIVVHSLETGRRLPFYNQVASMNATPDFSPDGERIYFSSTASGYAQIYSARRDGSDLRRLSDFRAVEVSPKISPKGGEVVFVSGRSGPAQIYRMNLDGANVERLTSGEGEASNPAWHPNGQVIAFSWSRGFEPGNFNVFIMDVTSRQFNQLTHGAGRNENPVWAPDGRHIVFASNRSGRSQVWTMLADGTDLRQLTTQGNNRMPVWGK
ncbi:MAG: PD40 domain-containing protein [Bryobacterales bacterium]|nr:PD40 domain-containing protein [Bryobacterales bacterium]